MLCIFILYLSAGKLDDVVYIVGLYFCFVSRFVSVYLSAFVAFVEDDIAFFRVRKRFYGAHDAAALTSPVPGVDVNVERAEALGAVVARCVAEREHLKAAVGADEAVVVFGEKFLFHILSFFSEKDTARVSFLFCLFLMNVELGERNLDAAFVENFLCVFEKVKVYRPVIGGVDPNAKLEFERVFALFAKTNERSGIFEHKFMRVCNSEKSFFNYFYIGIVFNGKFNIKTARIICAVVDDGSVCRCAVRDNDSLVVGSFERCVEKTDVCYSTRVGTVIDEIAYIKGFCAEKDYTACDIGKTALESKTYCKTARAEHRNERSRGNAYYHSDSDKEDYIKSAFEKVGDKQLCILGELVEAFALCDRFAEPSDKEHTNEKHNDSTDEFKTEGSDKYAYISEKSVKKVFHGNFSFL